MTIVQHKTLITTEYHANHARITHNGIMKQKHVRPAKTVHYLIKKQNDVFVQPRRHSRPPLPVSAALFPFSGTPKQVHATNAR